jgi:hypothetical protein
LPIYPLSFPGGQGGRHWFKLIGAIYEEKDFETFQTILNFDAIKLSFIKTFFCRILIMPLCMGQELEKLQYGLTIL